MRECKADSLYRRAALLVVRHECEYEGTWSKEDFLSNLALKIWPICDACNPLGGVGLRGVLGCCVDISCRSFPCMNVC